jgi:5-methylcytosine-specific restriction protein A
VPQKPKRACSFPGCKGTTDAKWCEEHERPTAWSSTRGSAHSRGYGVPWRKLREIILARDPICLACGVRASTDVDHVLAKAEGGDDDAANLQGLCGGCHALKTATEAARAQGRATPKPRGLRIDADPSA